MPHDTSVTDLLMAAGLGTLTAGAPPDAVEAALRALTQQINGADPLRVEALRSGAIDRLAAAGVRSPARLVDAALGQREAPHSGGLGSRITLEDPEPWPDRVDAPSLLTEIADVLARHIVLPEGGAVAAALWILHAHAHDASEVSPLLTLSSPERRCGKTNMLMLIGALVPRPLTTASVTAASVFRAVEAFRPTLLVDEADTFIQDAEELRGILNSGHHRAAAYVVRTVGDAHEARLFSTWCPKAIALIKDLPATLADRSITIRLRRKAPGEAVDRLRLDRLPELEHLRRRAWRWTRDVLDALNAADPAVPGELHDRAADNWRPLLAIADSAGGAWPEEGRKAARLLERAYQKDDETVGVQLLCDLRALFSDRRTTRLHSAVIAAELAKKEDRPWPEWRQGKPITPRQLARLLRPFGVGPKQVWDGTANRQGYALEDLEDTFSRYVGGSGPLERLEPNDGGQMGTPATPSEGGASRDRQDVGNASSAFGLGDLGDADPPRGEVEQYEAAERRALEEGM